MRGKDPEEHLHTLLHLLCPSEALIHPGSYPRRNRLTLLLIPSTLGRDALYLFLRDPLDPALQRHERRARGRGILDFERADHPHLHPSQDTHPPSIARAAYQGAPLIVKGRDPRQRPERLTQLDPRRMHRPARAVGIVALFDQTQPVATEM